MNKGTIFTAVLLTAMAMISMAAHAGNLTTHQPGWLSPRQYEEIEHRRHQQHEQKLLRQQREIEEAIDRQREAIEESNRLQRAAIDLEQQRFDAEQKAAKQARYEARQQQRAIERQARDEFMANPYQGLEGLAEMRAGHTRLNGGLGYSASDSLYWESEEGKKALERLDIETAEYEAKEKARLPEDLRRAKAAGDVLRSWVPPL